jgi:hypothetical protein
VAHFSVEKPAQFRMETNIYPNPAFVVQRMDGR